MPTHKLKPFSAVLTVALLAVCITGCGDVPVDASETDGPAAKQTFELDVRLCTPETHTWTLDIDNHYFPLPLGRIWEYEGDEDGTPLALRITVLDETEVVAGVTTRVVEEREWEDGELLEVSRNYFAQSEGGTVCYFGEAVEIYLEDGSISNEGAWRADEPGHYPGIYMPKNPRVGMAFQQEGAPGIAEDYAEIVGRNERVEVPYGDFKQTIITADCTGGGDCGEKAYARGLNLLIDEDLELISVE